MKTESNPSPVKEKQPITKLFLPSMAVSQFATSPLSVLTSLFLVDLALTFQVPVGVMGQINTVLYVVAVAFALLMGVLSVRFRHKLLLMAGLVLLSVSGLGFFVATDFSLMCFFNALSGVGIAMVVPMTMALVGEHLPFEKRSNAIGWIVASGAVAYFVGAPAMSAIAGMGGWRLAILGFVMPVSFMGVIMALIGVPSKSSNAEYAGRQVYLMSFKEVLSNRSALASLIGNVLRLAAFAAILLYGASFVRQQFAISVNVASIVVLGAALCYTLGSIVTGPIVNRFGRKRSTIFTALLAGMFTITYAYTANMWLSLTLLFVASWFSGMATSAATSLTLEQVPKYRGTMMSINTAAVNSGSALGAAIGGVALLVYDYQILGAVLGGMGLVAGLIFYPLTRDVRKEESMSA
ncbi:MAG TPA: MFS transporter [Candidatus Bathyarchaeia archaeon]|nr:MFS transporter [Candidatus Bathyarchaeia archaeon]